MKDQKAGAKDKSRNQKQKEEQEKSKGMVIIPFVEGLSEAMECVLKKHKISTAMKPHTTLKQLLVHPKDKPEIGEVGEIVYEIPCQSCDAKYIGGTGRLFRNRLQEHKQEVENVDGAGRFTRAERKKSETTYNKSAITDHTSRNNHIIDSDTTYPTENTTDFKLKSVRKCIIVNSKFENSTGDARNSLFVLVTFTCTY